MIKDGHRTKRYGESRKCGKVNLHSLVDLMVEPPLVEPLWYTDLCTQHRADVGWVCWVPDPEPTL